MPNIKIFLFKQPEVIHKIDRESFNAVMSKLFNELHNNFYTLTHEFTLDINFNNDEDVCEEVFDISNHFAREKDRSKIWKDARSLGIGDVCCVNGKNYLCCNIGWTEI